MVLFATPANPVPPDARVNVLVADDGIKLRSASWLATSGSRRGTICLLQGRAEYIEKYFETINDLRALGFAVATVDWRGQGGSERPLSNPRKGHVSHYDRYETDLVALIERVIKPDCPPPYFALAHSTGGLILLRFLSRRKTQFERVVFSAPFLGLGSAYQPVGLAKLLIRVASELGMSRLLTPTGSTEAGEKEPFLGNFLTSDKSRYARNANIVATEPSLGIGAPTIGWVQASLNAMADIESEGALEKIRVPSLILVAGNDAIVSNQAIESNARRLALGRHLYIDGAQHELLMERDLFREQFLAALHTFLSSA